MIWLQRSLQDPKSDLFMMIPLITSFWGPVQIQYENFSEKVVLVVYFESAILGDLELKKTNRYHKGLQ